MLNYGLNEYEINSFKSWDLIELMFNQYFDFNAGGIDRRNEINSLFSDSHLSDLELVRKIQNDSCYPFKNLHNNLLSKYIQYNTVNKYRLYSDNQQNHKKNLAYKKTETKRTSKF